jgi:hypothetical protein
VDPEDGAGLAPKFVKFIVLALFRRKNMDYNLSQVEEYPA